MELSSASARRMLVMKNPTRFTWAAPQRASRSRLRLLSRLRASFERPGMAAGAGAWVLGAAELSAAGTLPLTPCMILSSGRVNKVGAPGGFPRPLVTFAAGMGEGGVGEEGRNSWGARYFK